MTQDISVGWVGRTVGLARKVGSRAWQSPTVTAWGSVGTRAISALVVLPLILTRLSTQEIAVWYLLVTVMGLQQLADLGFAPTFTRVIAFAMGGANDLRDLRAVAAPGSGFANWPLIGQIWATMRVVYWRLTLASCALLLVFGTWALQRPIGALTRPQDGWTAWVIILGMSVVVLRGNAYGAYLQGVNQVALFRRWEALTTLGAMFTSFAVLLLGGRLVALVVANQGWMVLNVLRDWQLSRHVEGGRYRAFHERRVDPAVMSAVWPSAWRSGVGISFSRGVLYASGLIYAQVADAAAVASYLIAFRVIQTVSDFANAPFYSKLPLLARLRSEGRVADQVRVAERGMRLAYWTYALAFVGIGLSASWLLDAIHSHVSWVSPALWGLLGLAFFTERFGAMHIQLYSTTNHIIWHIANGVSGTIYLVVSLATLRTLGVFAFPLGILVGYLVFYSWYGAWHVFRAFEMDFFRFQRGTVLAPGLVVLAYSSWAVLGR
jgi:hypothetical protein